MAELLIAWRNKNRALRSWRMESREGRIVIQLRQAVPFKGVFSGEVFIDEEDLALEHHPMVPLTTALEEWERSGLGTSAAA